MRGAPPGDGQYGVVGSVREGGAGGPTPASGGGTPCWRHRCSDAFKDRPAARSARCADPILTLPGQNLGIDQHFQCLRYLGRIAQIPEIASELFVSAQVVLKALSERASGLVWRADHVRLRRRCRRFPARRLLGSKPAETIAVP